jgi:hypothetical protein
VRDATSTKSCVLMRVSREGFADGELVVVTEGGGLSQSGCEVIVDSSSLPRCFEEGRVVRIREEEWISEYEVVASRPA